jgi:hypothetical protein
LNRVLNTFLAAFLACSPATACPNMIERQALQARLALQGSVKRVSPIDLAKIEHITPKGRVQDKEYHRLEAIEQIITGGKESIPFLISQLESEKRVEGRVLDYWSNVTVGDIAFIILIDFFLDPTWQKSTIAGLTWNEFLEIEKDSALAAEQQLRNYIAKHGRRQIKAKWQKIWAENQERLYWDEIDRCFKLKPL